MATRLEREARFEAARKELATRLGGARDDGWFTAPGVTATRAGRDVELRWPGGPEARTLRVAARIRTGESFSARPRARLLRWLGRPYLALSGTAPAAETTFGVERLLRDLGALRVVSSGGLLRADLAWDTFAPDVERVVRVLERLEALALALEGAQAPRVESGGALVCPFCKQSLEDAAIARCTACGAPHHPVCFEEGHGCAILGCRNRTSRMASGSDWKAQG